MVPRQAEGMETRTTAGSKRERHHVSSGLPPRELTPQKRLVPLPLLRLPHFRSAGTLQTLSLGRSPFIDEEIEAQRVEAAHSEPHGGDLDSKPR